MLVQNGIIIQLKHKGKYQGIEGENWPFDFEKLSGEFKDFYDKNIDVSWRDDRYVDCCNDLQYIKKYLSILQNENLDYRILLCETNRTHPVMHESQLKTVFLGYDYAYAGGSFYSCVNNDIGNYHIPEFAESKTYEFTNLYGETIEIYGGGLYKNNSLFKAPIAIGTEMGSDFSEFICYSKTLKSQA